MCKHINTQCHKKSIKATFQVLTVFPTRSRSGIFLSARSAACQINFQHSDTKARKTVRAKLRLQREIMEWTKGAHYRNVFSTFEFFFFLLWILASEAFWVSVTHAIILLEMWLWGFLGVMLILLLPSSFSYSWLFLQKYRNNCMYVSIPMPYFKHDFSLVIVQTSTSAKWIPIMR